MLQLSQLRDSEAYTQLIQKLNNNFDVIATSSGGEPGPRGDRGLRGFLGGNGIRGIRYFLSTDDLSSSIEGDWQIALDGNVTIKNAAGTWTTTNFNIKGQIGLKGDSGETSELNRFAGTLGDAFGNSYAFSPNSVPTTSKSLNSRDFISLKRSQDILVVGDASHIKTNFANFPSEGGTSSLLILQDSVSPNAKNGITIGVDGLKKSDTPSAATSDYSLFAHLYIDDSGNFVINKDFAPTIISSTENITLSSGSDYFILGNENNNRGIFAYTGSDIKLSTQISSLEISQGLVFNSQISNILSLEGKTTPLVNDETYTQMKSGDGILKIGIQKIHNYYNSPGFGVFNFDGFAVKIQLDYPNNGSIGVGTVNPIFLTKNGSIYLGDVTQPIAFNDTFQANSLYVGGLLQLNTLTRSRQNSELLVLSDAYGIISLYDENGATQNNINPQGFKFGMFYKSNVRNTLSLVNKGKIEIFRERDSSELLHGISIITDITGSDTDVTPSILLKGDMPSVEFKITNSKKITFGEHTQSDKLFYLPKGQYQGAVIATLSDPLNNFSDSWRVLQIKRNEDNSLISDFSLSKVGGLLGGNANINGYWYKTNADSDLDYFNYVKLSSGRDFRNGNLESITPYSKISLQRINKDIWLLNISITILQNSTYSASFDNLDFLEVSLSDRIGILKPIINGSTNVDFDGQSWLPCSVHTSGYFQRNVNDLVNWNTSVKKFVRSESNHQYLNSASQFKGCFTMDRVGNNKTAIQFSIQPISNAILQTGITIGASCLCYGYREQIQQIETFDSVLFTEEV